MMMMVMMMMTTTVMLMMVRMMMMMMMMMMLMLLFLGLLLVPRRPQETAPQFPNTRLYEICVQRFPTQNRNFCLAARVPAENRHKGYAKEFRQQS